MSSYSELVDELRFCLAADHIELNDELRSLAERYAAACHEVNRRLQRCEEFLKRELRAEAIQFAETEPPLLDAVTVLEFPERSEWDQTVSLYQLPRAEYLLLGISETLNEAYSRHAPLDSLLRRHRRLALARAPLPERMEVLRALIANDAGTNVWEEDLSQLEKARLQQIEQHYREWTDVNVVADAVRELEQPVWRPAPSPSLIKGVKQHFAGLRRQRGLAACRALEPQLNAAFGELNAAAARELRGLWETATKEARLTESDPLTQQVEPVLGWLADLDAADQAEEEFQSLIQQLERALDLDRPVDDLERLAIAIQSRLQRDIPEPLGSRFRSKVASLQLNAGRKRTLLIGGGIAGVAVLVALVVGLVRMNAEIEQIRRVAESVRTMLHDGQVAEARALFERHSTFTPTDAWLAVGKEVADGEQQEQERIRRLTAALETIQASETLQTVESAVEEASSLARSAHEKKALATARKELTGREAVRRKSAETEWRRVVGGVSGAVAALDAKVRASTNADEIRAAAKSATEKLQELTSLETLAPVVSSSVAAERTLVQQRLGDVLKLCERESSRLYREGELDRLVERLRTGNGDVTQEVGAYAAALEKYVADFPEAASSGDYRKAAAERPRWEAAVVWQKLAVTWATVIPMLLEDQRARVAQLDAFTQKYHESPEGPLAIEYRDTLQSVLRRFESASGERPAVRQVLDVFQGALVKGVHTLKDRKGRIFYLTEPYKWDGKSAGAPFKYYSNTGGRTKNTTIIISELEMRESVLSPQAQLGETAAELLKSKNDLDWLAVTEQLTLGVFEIPRLDPLLRHRLLVDLIDPMSAGDFQLQRELEPYKAKLDDARIDDAARWMDPEDEDAPAMRQIAEELLKEIQPDLLAAWGKARAKMTELDVRLHDRWGPAGRLVRLRDGQWTVLTTLKTSDSYRLGVVQPNSVGFAPIAQLTSIGVENVQKSLPELMVEGRLVFASPGASPLASK